ncbi:hypothetical protein MKW92_006287 [Papaver armeniacum]|nr:hypothetical protein MKW92_006287 [Papaver armeniacum]
MDENKCLVADDDVWQYMKSKRRAFPEFYLAYSHLQKKNWVVRSGLQYGADFVAYRHHPSLVHSDFVVIVDFNKSSRLRVWSDIEGMIRLFALVAKTLMVLSVNTNDCDVVSPSELDLYKVEGEQLQDGLHRSTARSTFSFWLWYVAYRKRTRLEISEN